MISASIVETIELPTYRITRVDRAWHVVRPNAAMAHTFRQLGQAMDFVRHDCGRHDATVELMIDDVYIVKQIEMAAHR